MAVTAVPGIANLQNVTRLFGQYHTQAVYQNMFHVATATAGVSLLTQGSTTQVFGLWNPAGSGVLLVPTALKMGLLANVTVAALVWSYQTGLGTGAAGTSPVTAVTKLTPTNGRPGLNKQTPSFGFSSITLAAAPTLLRYSGMAVGSALATTPEVINMVEAFDGDIVVDPGMAIFLSGTSAPGGAMALSLSYLEVPFV